MPRPATKRIDKFLLMRTFCVFNADQVEGAEQIPGHRRDLRRTAGPDFEPAEELMRATGADIRHGGRPGFLLACRGFHLLAQQGKVRHARHLLRIGLSRIGPLVANPALIGTARPTATRWAKLVAEMTACYRRQRIGHPERREPGKPCGLL